MLEVEGLVVSYADGWDLQASFCLESQTWTSIVGASGSGKSTLVQAIAGFVPIKSGSILCDGVAIHGLRSVDRKLSYVFQNQQLFDHLSVLENLLLALHDSGLSRPEKLRRAQDLTVSLKIDGTLLGRLPAQLSGGERARVVVARALLRGHKWLILDESFAALDEDLRFEIQCWIESLISDEGLSVISVTHQLQDARFFSDRVLQIANGRIVFDGPTLPERQSQIEMAEGRIELLGPQDFVLSKSITTSTPQGALRALQRPFLTRVGSQWVLRERGKRTLLYLPSRPDDVPSAIALLKTTSG